MGPPGPTAAEMNARAKAEREFQAKVIADARNAAEFVRHASYMTRLERIEHLKDYAAANAATLGQVGEANKVLHDEIMFLERSRLDQMRLFYAEMRERSQNAYLTAMEFAAQYARQVQDDFVHLWDPFIDGTKSAKQAMLDFFRNMLIKLAQAQAQMAMLKMWDAGIGGAFGGLVQHLFAGMFHGGGRVGAGGPGRMVPAATFAGAPRYHRGLGARERPAILEIGEEVIPAGQPRVVIYNEIKAMDSQDVQRALMKERSFLGGLNIMNAKSNHPMRRGGV
jgi:hypothetical protein